MAAPLLFLDVNIVRLKRRHILSIFRANNRAQGQICGNKTLWLCSKSSLFTVYTDSTIKSGISMLLDKRQNTRVHIPKHNKYWGQHTKYWESGRNNHFSFLCPLFFFSSTELHSGIAFFMKMHAMLPLNMAKWIWNNLCIVSGQAYNVLKCDL